MLVLIDVDHFIEARQRKNVAVVLAQVAGQHVVLLEGEMPGQPTSRAVVVRTLLSSDQVSDGVVGGT
jgi:hypothetical protein